MQEAPTPAAKQLTARGAVELLAHGGGGYAFIDVRSPGEFFQGNLPHCVNLPILTDSERHEVGLCFKHEGSAAAFLKARTLVAPMQAARIEAWRLATLASAKQTAIMCCWRGGQRSAYAASWLLARGSAAMMVEGGYKAMRHELLQKLQAPPPLLVLAGLTGSGKSRLLRELNPSRVLDLEALAVHRGSAFGGWPGLQPPRQASFENQMGLKLWCLANTETLVEDESALIGALYLSQAMVATMTKAPIIFLEATLEERCDSIFQEYIAQPLAQGVTTERVREKAESGLESIKKRLGGALTATIRAELQAAFFAKDQQAKTHRSWIGSLLTNYYDRMYSYGFAGRVPQVIFRGTLTECRHWLDQRLQ